MQLMRMLTHHLLVKGLAEKNQYVELVIMGQDAVKSFESCLTVVLEEAVGYNH